MDDKEAKKLHIEITRLRSFKYHDGQKLKSISHQISDDCWFGASIDNEDIDDITVIMENGQMAAVPWALIEYSDGRNTKINLASMTNVELRKQS